MEAGYLSKAPQPIADNFLYTYERTLSNLYAKKGLKPMTTSVNITNLTDDQLFEAHPKPWTYKQFVGFEDKFGRRIAKDDLITRQLINTYGVQVVTEEDTEEDLDV